MAERRRHLEPDRSGGFIQPDAFANDKTIWRNQDPVDNNSLATGGTLRNTPTWTPGSFRVAGTWNAPKNIVVSTSYTVVGGPWTGPILKQLAANDPDVWVRACAVQWHDACRQRRSGQSAATRIRFLYPTAVKGRGSPVRENAQLQVSATA